MPDLSFTVSWSLLKLISIESKMPSNHLILCHPLLLPPSIFLSIRIFSSESVLLIMWPKCFGASASVSVLPMNIQDWFPLGWTCLVSLQSKGLSRVFSSTTVQRHQCLSAQPFIMYLYQNELLILSVCVWGGAREWMAPGKCRQTAGVWITPSFEASVRIWILPWKQWTTFQRQSKEGAMIRFVKFLFSFVVITLVSL